MAKPAKAFDGVTILSTVAEATFSSTIFGEIRTSFPEAELIDRPTMSTWEDGRITDRINAIGKNKFVLAGLRTSVCTAGPAPSPIDLGFEAYVIADACGDVSEESREQATERTMQLGVRPMTSLQDLPELWRDWPAARPTT